MKSIQFFKGLSWLIILNLLVKPVWIFFIDRQVQNVVGYEEYGKYFAILNLSYVLFFLSDAGLSNMINQKVANNISVDVKQLLQIKLILLLSYFILFCFVGWLTHISDWRLLFFVVIFQVLTSLVLFLRNIISANQFFTTDAWLSVIDKFLMIVLCGSILYTSFLGTISLILFLQIQIVCTSVAVAICFFLIIRKKIISSGAKENVDAIVKQISPFAIIILLMSFHYRFDGFLLERTSSALQAGIYASAYRLLDASNMIGYLSASFLVPFVARHLDNKKLVEEATLNTRHFLLLCSIAISSFAIVFSSWIENILYHSNSGYNSLVIQLCMAAFPGYCLVHVYGAVLTAASKFKQLIFVLILSVILNIVSNTILIPSYGAVGCCVAALASQYFCGLAICIVATKQLKIPFHFQSIALYIMTAALLTGFFYFGKTAIINVWVILAIAVCFSFLILITQLSFFKKYFLSFVNVISCLT